MKEKPDKEKLLNSYDKTNRNCLCPCESGKKYKNCCMKNKLNQEIKRG